MSQEPYRLVRRVFSIVDNGSSHRGERAAQELHDRYPRMLMVHTPVHASWLNQIELWRTQNSCFGRSRQLTGPRGFVTTFHSGVRFLRAPSNMPWGTRAQPADPDVLTLKAAVQVA